MTVYLTWPKDAGDFRSAVAANEVRAVCAGRASVAAGRRALRLPVPKHPHYADVMVMPAHQLGTPRERPRCYGVRFSRSVDSVEASS